MREAEFRNVFLRHKDAVYGFAWRLTGSPEAAEDIAQDVFLSLLRGTDKKNRSERDLRSYLLAAARNLAFKRWRTEQRWNGLNDDQFTAEPLDFDGFEIWEAVASAIALLPPLQRETLILHAYEGCSPVEIARLTETDPGTIKARLHRARENMKRLLGPLGEHTRGVQRNGTTQR